MVDKPISEEEMWAEIRRQREPRIELQDYRPSKEDPHSHVHCDVCESPEGLAICFVTYPSWNIMTRTLEEPEYMTICRPCLERAIGILNAVEST